MTTTSFCRLTFQSSALASTARAALTIRSVVLSSFCFLFFWSCLPTCNFQVSKRQHLRPLYTNTRAATTTSTVTATPSLPAHATTASDDGGGGLGRRGAAQGDGYPDVLRPG